MSIEIMDKKSNIIKDIDIFQTSLFVSKRLSSGAIEAFYSQNECNQHYNRFFEINSSALLNDELLIIDAHTYRVDNRLTVCAKNEDIAKAIYYKLFSENKFVHNSYELEINITKDGYDAFIYSATKLTASPIDSFSFNIYDIDELLKQFYKKAASLKSLSPKTYTYEEMVDDCIEYEQNKIDTKLFYKDF